MAQIHCLIRRVGPTTIVLESTKYTFMPIPGTKYHKEQKYDHVKQPDGTIKKVFKMVSVPEESTSVCDVGKEEHVKHLLALSYYEEYDQEKIDADRKKAKEEAAKAAKIEGFDVEKYMDSGYVAVDKRKKPYKYHGEVGDWVPKGTPLTPFKSTIEAFTFLKDEAEFMASDGDDLDKDLDELGGKKTKKTMKED